MRLPNHTQTPNEFIDNHMKGLSGAAAKIFLAICRKTIGWHKASDAISYSQLSKATGLQTEAISKGLKELKEANLIGVYPRGPGKTPYYDINFAEEVETTSSEIEEDHFDNRSTTSSEIEDTKEKKETSKRNGLSYSQEFEEFWSVYPKKEDKYHAYEKYKATKRRGTTAEMLLMAAKCYARYFTKPNSDVKYAMQAKRFLGPGQEWLEWYNNAEQIRRAEEKVPKSKYEIKTQPELTPTQIEANKKAVGEMMKSLNVKFGARRV